MIVSRNTLRAVLFGLFALGMSAPALAETDCRSDCSEARKICRRASHAAYKSCRSGCRETVNEAAQRARAVCELEELGPRECHALVKDSVAGALKACRVDCRNARKLARAVCSEERSDCRNVCIDERDPICVDGCKEDFDGCRVDLAACADTCRSDREAAVEACKASSVVDGACSIDALRECLREARHTAHECLESCHEESPCGSELRQCVMDCPAASE